ncbi:Smr/MutS family protein [Allorhizobium borbori]|uniref:DNA-nicking Smr family endonuclease n=1 Tax=Allorhizobium borbori TaxID=485907 RepID=A0A7W6P1Z4_9HYPH|nr:Smr/MutS family protein [Allorhizobium borbori]MBB4104093.1 DNA-nicking Smr family endonuclease [Allorhizobium borbori]
MARKGKRDLDTDERVLWGKIARTVRPLAGRMEDLLKFEESYLEPAPVEPEPPTIKKVGQGSAESLVNPDKDGKNPAKHCHYPLEKPVKRKLSRGALALEARIDLHGMFQSEAHTVLLDFIIRAHERGLRHVLVITGKGSSMGSEGALKRAVPLWFSKPEFRFFISSYEPAARNHGGEGAFYVRLSRQRGDRS